MFCKKCGTQLPENAENCPNCGNVIKTEKNNNIVEDNEIQLQLKSTFKFVYLLPSLPIYLGLVLVTALIFSLLSIKIGLIVAIIGIIALIIAYKIGAKIKRDSYSSYYYNFYKTKIIYIDNYVTMSDREIMYKNIKEVMMHQTISQKFFNIGNIYLLTNAGFGINMRNIENAQNNYSKIKSMIEDVRR